MSPSKRPCRVFFIVNYPELIANIQPRPQIVAWSASRAVVQIGPIHPIPVVVDSTHGGDGGDPMCVEFLLPTDLGVEIGAYGGEFGTYHYCTYEDAIFQSKW